MVSGFEPCDYHNPVFREMVLKWFPNGFQLFGPTLVFFLQTGFHIKKTKLSKRRNGFEMVLKWREIFFSTKPFQNRPQNPDTILANSDMLLS